MGGITVTRTCKSCGTVASRGTYFPELVVFAIALVVFVFLYPKIGWGAILAGSPSVLDMFYGAALFFFVVIMPVAELWRAVLANRQGGRSFPEKCPNCGGAEFDEGGGFH